MFESYTPFCRACEDFHEESSCHYAFYVQEHCFPEGCGPKASSRKPEYVNTVEQLYLVTIETWIQASEYNQKHDTSDEESLTFDMDDDYETLLEDPIFEVLCDENPLCSPPDDKYLESWDPYDIFVTQLFEEDCYDHKEDENSQGLGPVMNTLSYLT